MSEHHDLDTVYNLLQKVQAENENCAKDIASMHLELEQIKVQKLLLSGILQEKEQQLASSALDMRAAVETIEQYAAEHAAMRALLEEIAPIVENVRLYSSEYQYTRNLWVGKYRAFLAQHPEQESLEELNKRINSPISNIEKKLPEPS